jgi:NTP pyrophosphatase (non-canonical NTP hydrolase)
MNSKQNEILLIAQEECAEVTQAISKIFRFGMDAKHPNEDRNNKQRLTEEVGDLLCMIELLIANGVVDEMSVYNAKNAKMTKLAKWSNIFDKE